MHHFHDVRPRWDPLRLVERQPGELWRSVSCDSGIGALELERVGRGGRLRGGRSWCEGRGRLS